MNNYFVFDSYISYDCKKCKGLCCNLNSTLVFTKEQLKSIEITMLRDFFTKKGDFYYCKSPKRCWFLKDNLCCLQNNKPVFCKLYPLKISKLSNNINIIEIIPCPTMFRGSYDRIGEYTELLNEFTSSFPVLWNSQIYKIKNFKITNKDFCLKMALIEYGGTYDTEIKYPFLKQIFAQPFTINIISVATIKELINDFYEFYNRLLTLFNSNYQNFYIILKSNFDKYVLYKFYHPINKKGIKIIKKREIRNINDYFSTECYKEYHDTTHKEFLWEPKDVLGNERID